MAVTTAMILAAGRGNRLRPLTDETPKPLLQVGKLRLIEYHLIALAASNVCRVVINLSYLGHKIRDFLGDGSSYGIEISYSYEPAGALETAGGIRHALEQLGAEQFIVVNGDIFCNIQFNSLNLKDDSSMHLVMVPNPDHHPQGDFSLDRSFDPARLCANQPGRNSYTFSGVGIYRKEVFSSLPDGYQALSPIIQQYIASSRVTAELHQGYWIDVGTLERLQQVRALALALP